MTGTGQIAVIGAGIVGVAAATWLRRQGAEVILIDRHLPGQGASFGNAGVLAACSVAPVTAPGLARKAPRMLLDRRFPLFLRWPYLPRLAPWLIRYLAHANQDDTVRIAAALAPIVADSVAQHTALAEGTPAAAFLRRSDYHFAYADRKAFEAEASVWELRSRAGFRPVVREGADVHAHEPSLSADIGLLASVPEHGFVRNPGAYVGALAAAFTAGGGRVLQAGVSDFDLSGGRLRAIETDRGSVPCDACVLSAGIWSRPLVARLGLRVPLESERGYHILFRQARGGPREPVMVASGKFVATPMEGGLRCAGLLEFGGTRAGPSRAPLAFLRRAARAAFPALEAVGEEEWLGHRPAPSDSLPLIGEVGATGVFAAFGHHHIGLTGGPKTGRLVADLVGGRSPDIDMAPYAPDRFHR